MFSPAFSMAASRRSFCEFKGAASYWHLVVNGRTSQDAAWSYEDPSPGFEQLRGMIAFYPGRVDRCLLDDETVEPQSGHFYGGWITAGNLRTVQGWSRNLWLVGLEPASLTRPRRYGATTKLFDRRSAQAPSSVLFRKHR